MWKGTKLGWLLKNPNLTNGGPWVCRSQWDKNSRFSQLNQLESEITKMQNRKNWKEKELYRRHISLGVLGHDVMLILPFQEHNSRNRKFEIGQLTMSIVQNSKNWRLAIHELYNGTYISLAPLTSKMCLLRRCSMHKADPETGLGLKSAFPTSASPIFWFVPPNLASRWVLTLLPTKVLSKGAVHSSPGIRSFQWSTWRA